MYLSYDDLADVEENITEPKRKGKQKLFNSQSKVRKKTTPVSLNRIKVILSVKKDLLIRFMKVTLTTKMFKCQKAIIQSIKKVNGTFLTFFLVQIPVMNNVSFISSQQELPYKNTCSAKTCSEMKFFSTYGQNPLEIHVKEIK